MQLAQIVDGIVVNIAEFDPDDLPDRVETEGWVDATGLYVGQNMNVDPNDADAMAAAELHVRNVRNAFLFETDWWMVSDQTPTPEQIAYRQALRDITAQEGFPLSVVWPKRP